MNPFENRAERAYFGVADGRRRGGGTGFEARSCSVFMQPGDGAPPRPRQAACCRISMTRLATRLIATARVSVLTGFSI